MKAKKFTKAEDYIYASTRIRLLQKGLLSATEKVQFLQADSFTTALQLFKTSSYGKRLEGKKSHEDILTEEAKFLRQNFAETAQGSPLVRLLVLSDVYHNLKVLFKMIFLDAHIHYLLHEVPEVDTQYLRAMYEHPTLNPRETLEEKAIDIVVQDFQKYKDPERVEVLLDKSLYQAMQETGKVLGSELIATWLKEQIDYTNLSIFLRMKRVHKKVEWLDLAFIEGGSVRKEELVKLYELPDLPGPREMSGAGMSHIITQSWEEAVQKQKVSVLEKARDERSLFYADKGGRYTYGPEVLFAYYIQRKIEIQNLRTLMIALRSGLSAEQREEHLRIVS